jgi:hypothetical protein
MVATAGINAGLDLAEECIALICGVRNGARAADASPGSDQIALARSPIGLGWQAFVAST